MREWRERVIAEWERRMKAAGNALGLAEAADAAIAELLPLVKAELAKVVEDCPDRYCGLDYAAVIKAGEPQHD